MKLALRDDDSKVLPALTEDIVFSLLFFAGIPIATLFSFVSSTGGARISDMRKKDA